MRARYTTADDDGQLNETVTEHLHLHEMRLQLDHEHEEHETGQPPSGRELKLVLRENGDVEITGLRGVDDLDADLAIVPDVLSNRFRVRFVTRPTGMHDIPGDRP